MKSNVWSSVNDAIFFTTPEMGWQKEWDILLLEGEPVTDIETAKSLVRQYMASQAVGLATFSQMTVNNAEWDNL